MGISPNTLWYRVASKLKTHISNLIATAVTSPSFTMPSIGQRRGYPIKKVPLLQGRHSPLLRHRLRAFSTELSGEVPDDETHEGTFGDEPERRSKRTIRPKQVDQHDGEDVVDQ